MLTRLHFKNFKAWKDSGKIRLAPLTVLFGTNSAGKTSVLQILKQTAESPDRQRALHLGDNRTLVDLGTYGDAVHNHDVTQPLEVEIEWTLGGRLVIFDPLSKTRYAGDTIGLRVAIQGDRQSAAARFAF
jgi:hypothetical protein